MIHFVLVTILSHQCQLLKMFGMLSRRCCGWSLSLRWWFHFLHLRYACPVSMKYHVICFSSFLWDFSPIHPFIHPVIQSLNTVWIEEVLRTLCRLWWGGWMDCDIINEEVIMILLSSIKWIDSIRFHSILYYPNAFGIWNEWLPNTFSLSKFHPSQPILKKFSKILINVYESTVQYLLDSWDYLCWKGKFYGKSRDNLLKYVVVFFWLAYKLV